MPSRFRLAVHHNQAGRAEVSNYDVCLSFSIPEWGGGVKLIYRHYATLYFVFAVDQQESDLGILDLIQGRLAVHQAFGCSMFAYWFSSVF